MPTEEYTAVPLDEHATYRPAPRKGLLGSSTLMVVFGLVASAIICFVLGFAVGQNWDGGKRVLDMDWSPSQAGLLPPQAFLPDSKRHTQTAVY